ncbi:MAG: hypothetical protein K9H61_00995 [Bacteroidia bacterium]|nr:hypothetical protein [Bacteroidia bacterium]MCF8445543.1 hypothetical protein [Bacteroidia bacterium]
MKYTIELNDCPKDHLVLGILKELKVKMEAPSIASKKGLTAKDLAFGLGRKATKSELVEYANRADKSELIDIEELLNEYSK